MKLVREASEAAESRKEKERERAAEGGRGGAAAAGGREPGSSSPESQFIWGVVRLHDKYMEYVTVRAGRGVGRGRVLPPGVPATHHPPPPWSLRTPSPTPLSFTRP